MRVAVLGAGGMLATALAETFASETPTLLTKNECDLARPDEVRRTLMSVRPDVVLNAAAFTAVDDAEQQEAAALAVNGTALETLGAAVRDLGATFVHYSTDYVFPGTDPDGYAEDDATGPINAYGRSKLAGERALADSGVDYYLIRTSWLYGPNGKNFVDTILKLARERGTLSVVNDQAGSPTYTVDLARATRALLSERPTLGTYHRTNDGSVTWYGLAAAILELSNVPATLTPVTTALFPRPAPRPTYSVLRTTKLPPLRPWRDALADYLNPHPHEP